MPGTSSARRSVQRKIEARKLLQVGLVIEREQRGPQKSGHYDRFRDRIMFPIRDARVGSSGLAPRLGPRRTEDLNHPMTRPRAIADRKHDAISKAIVVAGLLRSALLALDDQADLQKFTCLDFVAPSALPMKSQASGA